MDRVIIFDTSLRDGEQSLASSLSVKDKLQIAIALERLGVDVMEVGFPISSPGDFQSVQTIASKIKDSRVAALSRAVPGDIEAAAQALSVASQFRIHTFIATSSIHVKDKLRKSFDEIQTMAVNAVKLAAKYTDDVEFSCEDTSRTDIDDICRMVEATINAGATTINLPDTVGYAIPEQYAAMISSVINRVPNIHKAILSVHCHNDLGMATANSLAAVKAGARQIECTINGIGERAGNCALEEVVMALEVRKDYFGLDTNIKYDQIHRVSQLVSQICNTPIQPNKAIVGANAFSHSSGIHQDGMLKASNTYEILSPQTIGVKPQGLNLTSRSGSAAIRSHMENMGYIDGVDYNLDLLYKDFKELADKKGQVYDYDLEALAFIENQERDEVVTLNNVVVNAQSNGVSTATVNITVEGQEKTDAATGNGPIDAIYSCIKKISNIEFQLIDYKITSKSQGNDALGQVDIIIKYQERNFHGIGLDTDILVSSSKALVKALNSVYQARQVASIKNQYNNY